MVATNDMKGKSRGLIANVDRDHIVAIKIVVVVHKLQPNAWRQRQRIQPACIAWPVQHGLMFRFGKQNKHTWRINGMMGSPAQDESSLLPLAITISASTTGFWERTPERLPPLARATCVVQQQH
jgi:hypothetical protein